MPVACAEPYSADTRCWCAAKVGCWGQHAHSARAPAKVANIIRPHLTLSRSGSTPAAPLASAPAAGYQQLKHASLSTSGWLPAAKACQPQHHVLRSLELCRHSLLGRRALLAARWCDAVIHRSALRLRQGGGMLGGGRRGGGGRDRRRGCRRLACVQELSVGVGGVGWRARGKLGPACAHRVAASQPAGPRRIGARQTCCGGEQAGPGGGEANTHAAGESRLGRADGKLTHTLRGRAGWAGRMGS
eukprot:365596-Chlamydomonas_euryale.AAC.1